ncbi:uncharacterized protein [Penaeus vannamei]|uniref:uncharacterized protein n=1 Tax=Penaeus vannamei TaxID=6689 RepID=UPI00387F4FAB
MQRDSPFPIAEKELFFHDSFFGDIQKYFETAVELILDMWGETKAMNDLTSGFTPVVLDAQDFKSGDVKVRVEGNQVVVEGRVEKEEGDFKSMKSFCRRFNFPGKVDMEECLAKIFTKLFPREDFPKVFFLRRSFPSPASPFAGVFSVRRTRDEPSNFAFVFNPFS